jgi:Spy/CpxP family protein refolding chaperone
MQKSRFVSLASSILLASFTIVAGAQQPSPTPSSTGASAGHTDDNTVEGITAHEHRKYESFVKNLSLTPEQQPKVKAVLDNRLAEEVAAINLDPDAKKARMKEINAESQGKIRAILNDDQRAKYNQSMKDEADRNAARQHKAAAAPAASADPAPHR